MGDLKYADIHFRCSSILKQKAQEEANTQDRSLSWIIIKALEQYLKGKTDEHPPH